MAALTYRLANVTVNGCGEIIQTDQTAANVSSSWKVAKTTSNNAAVLVWGTTGSTGFTAPTSTTAPGTNQSPSVNSSALRSDSPLTGEFDNSNWSLTFAVRASTASSQAGRIRCRIWKGTAADGSNAIEITNSANTLIGTTSSALSTTADVTTVVTWTPPSALIFNNEYLFIVVYWEITTASGSNNGDVILRTGQSSGGTRIVTGNFSPLPESNFPETPKPLVRIGLKDAKPFLLHNNNLIPDFVPFQVVSAFGDVITDSLIYGSDHNPDATIRRDLVLQGDGLSSIIQVDQFGTWNTSNLVQTANTARRAMSFTGIGGSITSVELNVSKLGSPTDNFVVEIWSDSGGSGPSQMLVSASVVGSTLNTFSTANDVVFNFSPLSVNSSSTYWIVWYRDTQTSTSNYYQVGLVSATGGIYSSSNAGNSWASVPSAGNLRYKINYFTTDSSFGLWRGSTNLITNGGFESGTTGWSAVAGGAPSVDTGVFYFGSQALFVGTSAIGDGTQTNVSVSGSTTYTFSVLVNAGTLSGTVNQLQAIDHGSSSVLGTSTASVQIRGNWYKYTLTFTTASGTTSVDLQVLNTNSGGWNFRIDAAQLEQQPYATPYIETNGATASRNAGYVTAPTSVLNAAQGWIAVRFRLEIPSTANNNCYLATFTDGTSSTRITLFTNPSQNNLSAWDGTNLFSASYTPTKGGVITAIIAWTTSDFKISVNGGSFVSLGSAPSVAGTPNQFLIGCDYLNIQQANGEILWTAAGTGTLSDADAATIDGFGDAGSNNSYPSLSAPTFYWPADTGAWVVPSIATGAVYTESATVTSITSVTAQESILNIVGTPVRPLLMTLDSRDRLRILDGTNILNPSDSVRVDYVESATISTITSIQSSESTDFLDTSGAVNGTSTITVTESTDYVESATVASVTSPSVVETTDYVESATVAVVTSLTFQESILGIIGTPVRPWLMMLDSRDLFRLLDGSNILNPSDSVRVNYVESATVTSVTSVSAVEVAQYVEEQQYVHFTFDNASKDDYWSINPSTDTTITFDGVLHFNWAGTSTGGTIAEIHSFDRFALAGKIAEISLLSFPSGGTNGPYARFGLFSSVYGIWIQNRGSSGNVELIVNSPDGAAPGPIQIGTSIPQKLRIDASQHPIVRYEAFDGTKWTTYYVENDSLNQYTLEGSFFVEFQRSGSTALEVQFDDLYVYASAGIPSVTSVSSIETSDFLELTTCAGITSVSATETTDYVETATVSGTTSITSQDQQFGWPLIPQPLLITFMRHTLPRLHNLILNPDDSVRVNYTESAVVSSVTTIDPLAITGFGNNAEGGSNGVTPTTSDTGSGNQWTTVTAGPNGTIKYSNLYPAHGTYSYQMGNHTATAEQTFLGWDYGIALSDTWGGMYAYWDGTPSAATQLKIFRTAGATIIGILQVNASMKLLILDASSTVVFTSTTTLSPNTQYRITHRVNYVSGTTWNIQVKLYLGDSLVALEDSGAIAVTAAPTAYQQVRIGRGSGTAANWPSATAYLYIDDPIDFASAEPLPVSPDTTQYVESATISSVTSITYQEQIIPQPAVPEPLLIRLGLDLFKLLHNNILNPDQIVVAAAGYVDSATVSSVTSVQSSESTDFIDTSGAINGTSSITSTELSAFVDSQTVPGVTSLTSTETTDYVESATVSGTTSVTLVDTADFVESATVSSVTSVFMQEQVVGAAYIPHPVLIKFIKHASLLLHNNILNPDNSVFISYTESATVSGVTSVQSSESTDFLDTSGAVNGASSITSTETSQYAESATIASSTSLTTTESTDYADTNTVIGTTTPTLVDTADYVESATVAGVTSIVIDEVQAGSVTPPHPLLIKLAKGIRNFRLLHNNRLTFDDSVRVNYTESATISSTTSLSITETTDFVESQSVAGVSSATVIETADDLEAATASGNTTPSITDTAQFVESATINSTTSLTVTETTDYVDTSTANGVTSVTLTDTADYVDSSTVSGTTTIGIIETVLIEPPRIHSLLIKLTLRHGKESFLTNSPILRPVTPIEYDDIFTVTSTTTPSILDTTDFIETVTINGATSPSTVEFANYIESSTCSSTTLPNFAETTPTDQKSISSTTTVNFTEFANYVDQSTTPTKTSIGDIQIYGRSDAATITTITTILSEEFSHVDIFILVGVMRKRWSCVFDQRWGSNTIQARWKSESEFRWDNQKERGRWTPEWIH